MYNVQELPSLFSEDSGKQFFSGATFSEFNFLCVMQDPAIDLPKRQAAVMSCNGKAIWTTTLLLTVGIELFKTRILLLLTGYINMIFFVVVVILENYIFAFPIEVIVKIINFCCFINSRLSKATKISHLLNYVEKKAILKNTEHNQI